MSKELLQEKDGSFKGVQEEEDFDVEEERKRIREKIISQSGDIYGGENRNVSQDFEDLKNNSKISEKAEELLSLFNTIIGNIEHDVGGMADLYREIFLDRTVDKNKLRSRVIKKAYSLMESASEELRKCAEEEKEEVIDNLIFNLRTEEKVREKTIFNIKSLVETLNEKYLEIEGYGGGFEKVSEERSDMYNFLKKKHNFSDEDIEKMKGGLKREMQKEEFGKYDSTEVSYMIAETYRQFKEAGMLDLDPRVMNSLHEKLFSHGSKELNEEEKNTLEKLNTDSLEHLFHARRTGEIRKISDEELVAASLRYGNKKIIEFEENLNKITKLSNLLEVQEKTEKELDGFVYGDKENELSEENNEHISHFIFKKYNEIVDETKNVKKSIIAVFKKEKKVNIEDLDLIAESMIKRAGALLKEYTEKINLESEIDKEEMTSRFEEQKADVVAFASIFKNAYQNKEADFEDLKGVDYYTSSSDSLMEDEKEMIRKVLKLNYPKKDQQVDILEKVEDSFQNEKTIWHLLTREGEDEKSLVSCIRFDEIDDKNVYSATFNVGPAYRGSKLGEAMFDRVMSEVAAKKKIHAIAEIGKPVSDFYINKAGFNVGKLEKNEKTGVEYYGIERFDKENEFYGTKKINDNKKLLSYYKPEAEIKDLINMQQYIIVKKEGGDKNEAYKNLEYILRNGYVVTRTIKEKEESFFVFEKKVSMKEGREEAA